MRVNHHFAICLFYLAPSNWPKVSFEQRPIRKFSKKMEKSGKFVDLVGKSGTFSHRLP
jgi:hypothetical protein